MISPVQPGEKRNIEDILDLCLRAIEQDKATVESCIARFPDYPELGPMLRTAVVMRDLPPLEMPAAFTAKTRQQLQMHLQQTTKAQPRSGFRLPVFARFAMAIGVFAIVLSLGGFTLVRTSSNTIPGDGWLYDRKRQFEQIQLFFASDQTRPEVLNQIAHDRLNELSQLTLRDQSVPDSFLSEMTDDVNYALVAQSNAAQRKQLISETLAALQHATSTGLITAAAAQQTVSRLSINPADVPAQDTQIAAVPSITPTSTPTATVTSTFTSTPTITATDTANAPLPITATGSQQTSEPAQPTASATATNRIGSVAGAPSANADPATPTLTTTPTVTLTIAPTTTLTPTATVGQSSSTTGQQGGVRITAIVQPITPVTVTPDQTAAGSATDVTITSTETTEQPTTVESTATPTVADTSTDTPTDIPTATDTATVRPTRTKVPTKTHTPTATATDTATATATATPLPDIPGLPPVSAKQNPQDGTFNKCAPEGSGGDPIFNRLANRTDEGNYGATSFDTLITLPWPQDIAHKPRDQWSAADQADVARVEGLPVTVEGYIAQVQQRGPEPANCNLNSDVSIQISLVAQADAQGDLSKAIIVIITPRVRANHAGWTLDKLNALKAAGTRVSISGWMLMNSDAADDAGKSRSSPYEIHPAMQISAQVNGQWIKLDDYQLAPTATPSPVPSDTALPSETATTPPVIATEP